MWSELIWLTIWKMVITSDGGNENWGCKNADKFLTGLGTLSFGIGTVLLGITAVDITLSVNVLYSSEKFLKNLGAISKF
jgi:hypothetical protein